MPPYCTLKTTDFPRQENASNLGLSIPRAFFLGGLKSLDILGIAEKEEFVSNYESYFIAIES